MRAKQFLRELNDPVTYDKDGPIVHVTMATLYHVTLTKNVAKIKSKGILPLQTSNWVQAGTGERYGGGYIFAFEHLVDAARWAAKWDWEISHKMGSGKVSVMTFTDDVNDWETDDADPLGQSSARGKWMKKHGHVPPQNIKAVQPATMDLIKTAVHESIVPTNKSVLFEYSRQITAQNLGEKLLAAAKKDRSIYDQVDAQHNTEVDLDWLMQGLEEVDPTPHKEYVQWLCKIYAGGQVKLEDLESRGKDTLERFNKLKIKKQLIPAHRDINSYKTFQQFEDTVSSYPEVEEQNVDKGQANLILDNANLRIIQPLNPAAAKYYGQGTKWCTAAKNNNMFEHYNGRGNLYVIIPKVPAYQGEKYQFHFEASQFMNEKDEYIDDSTMFNWIYLTKRFPELITLFADQATKNICIPLMPNGKAVVEQWEYIMEHVSHEVELRLLGIIPKVMKDVKTDVMSEGNASLEEASMIARNVGLGIKEDSYGLANTFVSRVTPSNIGNEDLLFDDVVLDSLEGWISENEDIADALEWARDRNKDFEDMGCSMAIAYAIAGPTMKLVRTLVVDSIQHISDEDIG